MRVLHVLNGVSGGAALSTAELVGGLAAAGVTNDAVCHAARQTVPSERRIVEAAFEHRVVYTSLYRWNQRIRTRPLLRPLVAAHQIVTTGGGWRSARRVVDAAREMEADLIHTNTFTTPDGAIAARALGIPHVWHVRELVGDGQPFRFHGGRRGFAAVAQGSHFVANSPATLSYFEQLVPGSVTHLVPNGLVLEPFLAVASDRSARVPRERTVVGMVAHLTSSLKRHELFIDAAALVRRPDVEFRVYGLDPATTGQGGRTVAYARALHQKVGDLGLADSFTFAGYRDDPAEIMGEIDILALPNETESFGRVAVEAMAAGVCVVAADSEALRFVLDEGRVGVLVAPGDPASLADGIGALVDDPDRRHRLGVSGAERAVEAFSFDRCCAAMIGIYEQARAEPATSSPLVEAWARLIPLRAAGIGQRL